MNVPVGSMNGPKASGDEHPSTLSNHATASATFGHRDTDVVDAEQPGDVRHGRASVPFRFGDQSGLLGSRSYAIPFG